MVGYSETRSPRLRFHAVTVVPGPGACPQAESVRDLRLLSADAPRLPMAGCDRPDQCDCRFKHHDDRRAGQRRRVERSIDPRHAKTPERRSVLGRRGTDWPED
ncbi:MAG TPA: hypothetical protein VFI92_15100 [Steroidobacteraceae bacterium]|nr:hypothetical protein [Steroidobacteraceae bacterium]